MPPSVAMLDQAALAPDDDAELVRRIAAGERAALDTLYRGYHRRLCRFLGRFTRRVDLMEEVINDTFWIVWQKADQFRGEARVSTWLMGIAYRCTLKALRQVGDDPVEPAALDDEHHPGYDPAKAHELADWLQKGLGRLPIEQRMTLELTYCAGYSLEETASIMDCPIGTVKARMFHARVKLRNLLPALAGAEDGNYLD